MSSRADLIERLSDLMRRASTDGLLIHQAIADQLGVGPTDIKCLDAARDEAQLTPGRLAEITGLSTSATTAALDRLERRGFIKRLRDEHDRRRVFVLSTGQHESETAHLYAPLAAATAEILDHYTIEQLRLIADFLERLNQANGQLIREKSLP
ncbi:MAG TPA: MarR family transcriptional regulator [Solirubrobacteraceae bacterium]|nr:MarR family transcriptional regulator [Solirubrobacteraceae bacterium]